MSWSTQSRQVAEPVGEELSATSVLGGAQVHIDVKLRTIEWPWEKNGPVSLVPQPTEVFARLNDKSLLLGTALPDPQHVVVPLAHSSTAQIRYKLFLSRAAIREFDALHEGTTLDCSISLVAHPLSVFHQSDYAPGINVVSVTHDHRFKISQEQWQEIVRSGKLEAEQQVLKQLEAQTLDLLEKLRDREGRVEALLRDVQEAAAKSSVSLQAQHFHAEADSHSDAAQRWLRTTIAMTLVLSAFAASTLFFHKVPWLRPETSLDAVQLTLGKTFVFGTLASFLFLALRNFAAHRHNAIINRHRENSLNTYRALVEAAGDQANRDIILSKAAESIFGVQSTGFTRRHEGDGNALSMVNLDTHFKGGKD